MITCFFGLRQGPSHFFFLGIKWRKKVERQLWVLTFLQKYSKYIKDSCGWVFCLWCAQKDPGGGLGGGNHRETAVAPWLLKDAFGWSRNSSGQKAWQRLHQQRIWHSSLISPSLSSFSLILKISQFYICSFLHVCWCPALIYSQLEFTFMLCWMLPSASISELCK